MSANILEKFLAAAASSERLVLAPAVAFKREELVIVGVVVYTRRSSMSTNAAHSLVGYTTVHVARGSSANSNRSPAQLEVQATGPG